MTPNSAVLLEARQITKVYRQGSQTLIILNGLDLKLSEKEKIAILGPSGSGKSTLLSILSGLSAPDSGMLFFRDQPMHSMNPDALTRLRAEHFGFVFQHFRLIPYLTALENVCLPLEWSPAIPRTQGELRAKTLLERMGLSARMDHLPEQLSGGEMQRVALARALITEPKIVFADEPTGNLDRKTGDEVMELLFENIETALVLVTHHEALAEPCGSVYRLENGKLWLV